jgi:hypothetical protein
MQTVQYASSYDGLKALPSIVSAPKTAEDLASWSIGDSTNYMCSGGLIFFAGINYMYTGPVVTAVAKGTWSVYVQKNAADTAYVKITKGKLQSLSMALAGPIISVGLSEFNNADDGFSFMVNLSSESGKRAFEDLVRGNVGAIQKLALEKGSDVTYISEKTVASKGKFFNFFFGIPIFANMTSSTGKIMTVSKTNFAIDDSVASIDYGVYLHETRSNVFFDHKDKTVAFTGAAYQVTDAKQNMTSSYFGQYSFDMGDENATRGKVGRMVREMIRKTGMKSQMQVDVPKADGQNLGYAGAHVEVIFSKDQTDELMGMAKSMTLERFVELNLTEARAYFAGEDKWSLCEGVSSEAADCADSALRETEESLRTMYKALNKMSSLVNSAGAGTVVDNSKEFVAAYAEFGKGLVKSPFALQAALLMAGEGVEVYYRIEGARISLYETYMATTDTGEFTVLSSPGQRLPDTAPVDRDDRDRGLIVGNRGPIYPL